MQNVPIKNSGDVLTAEQYNNLTRKELLNTLIGAGIVPDITDQNQLTKAILELVIPLGTVRKRAAPGPPQTQGLLGVTWELITASQGRLAVGASDDGVWNVSFGEAAGVQDSAQPTTLLDSQMPAHFHLSAFSVAIRSADTAIIFGRSAIALGPILHRVLAEPGLQRSTQYPLTETIGGGQPHGHTLENLKILGLNFWKRVA